jgi:hypothetical protein
MQRIKIGGMAGRDWRARARPAERGAGAAGRPVERREGFGVEVDEIPEAFDRAFEKVVKRGQLAR